MSVSRRASMERAWENEKEKAKANNARDDNDDVLTLTSLEIFHQGGPAEDTSAGPPPEPAYNPPGGWRSEWNEVAERVGVACRIPASSSVAASGSGSGSDYGSGGLVATTTAAATTTTKIGEKVGPTAINGGGGGGGGCRIVKEPASVYIPASLPSLPSPSSCCPGRACLPSPSPAPQKFASCSPPATAAVPCVLVHPSSNTGRMVPTPNGGTDIRNRTTIKCSSSSSSDTNHGHHVVQEPHRSPNYPDLSLDPEPGRTPPPPPPPPPPPHRPTPTPSTSIASGIRRSGLSTVRYAARPDVAVRQPVRVFVPPAATAAAPYAPHPQNSVGGGGSGVHYARNRPTPTVFVAYSPASTAAATSSAPGTTTIANGDGGSEAWGSGADRSTLEDLPPPPPPPHAHTPSSNAVSMLRNAQRAQRAVQQPPRQQQQQQQQGGEWEKGVSFELGSGLGLGILETGGGKSGENVNGNGKKNYNATVEDTEEEGEEGERQRGIDERRRANEKNGVQARKIPGAFIEEEEEEEEDA